MLIGGIQKFSLINYPKKTAAVIFTQGCRFLCHYCHNPELVLDEKFQKPLDEKEILEFLKKRQNQLDAVVISGGEPTLHKDLVSFIKKLKDLNYLVKLDTNGINPNIIKNLIDQKLLDYIAMDLKAPLESYSKVTNIDLGVNLIQDSINLIMSSKIEYEFRSTLVKNLHTKDDISKMAKLIKNASLYILQKFRPQITLNPAFSKYEAFSDEEMGKFQKTSLNYVKKCFIR
ncbi:MAG: 7-carboxy-7-deazaguanine synthase [Candidatus Anoxychlamydiales bacterium]|nr:7-carboxy-7-deazaguanine synthase [Candidatus Anoxychlamydiales bacterium]